MKSHFSQTRFSWLVLKATSNCLEISSFRNLCRLNHCDTVPWPPQLFIVERQKEVNLKSTTMEEPSLNQSIMHATEKDTTRLCWDLTPREKGGLHAVIYLKPEGESLGNITDKRCSPKEIQFSTFENVSVKQEEPNSHIHGIRHDPSLPVELEASVLQYQRQKRKMEASKRAGSSIAPCELDIVYEDDDIFVVNKPSGVLCVPGINNNPSIANILYDKLSKTPPEDTEICADPYSMTVHRLDMDTSGLICFGKTKSVVLALHRAFRGETGLRQNRRSRKHSTKHNNTTSSDRIQDIANESLGVTKEYEALVCGHLPKNIESGYINLPLQKDIHHPPFMRVSTPHSETLAQHVVDALRERNWTKLSKRNPKPSQTEFKVMSREYYCHQVHRFEKAEAGQPRLLEDNNRRFPVTRLSLIPITGRTHQLRVHCAAMGFPILGDPAYGIYGESAFCAGLYHNPVGVSGEHDLNWNPTPANKDKTFTPGACLRAPLSLQKALMEAYPPGEMDMCLHAKRLGFLHPTSGKMMGWEAPPKF